MLLERILNWLPLVTLIAVLLTSRVRAWAMHRRGVRAIIIDMRRPIAEQLYDTLLFCVGVFWIYLLVAEAWPLSLAWLPAPLTAKLFDFLPLKILGAALVLAAPILFAAALHSMGASWRIGIDRKHPGALVSNGIFRWTRNPIYMALDSIVIGAFLIYGRVIFLLSGLAFVLLVHGVVLREERFLEQRYGDAFREYCQRVRRYGIV
jgi:protein-S-isoprenylcysteine O-methyltransferase Ste14